MRTQYQKTCETCGQSYVTEHKHQKYCSISHQRSLHRNDKVCLTCGRGYHASHKAQKYCCIAHIPLSVKQAAGRKGRERGARTKRLRRFQEEIKRLPRRMTREDLLVIFQQIYTRGRRSEQAYQREQAKAS